MARWITDTEASKRFPVYTRSNASDVLPSPISPLGATLSWVPGVIEGWRDGNVTNGAFSADELASDFSPTCGFFNGFFYVNASVVRVFGERSGAGAAAIDAAFFGNRPDTPPYVAHPDDLNSAAAERIGAQMGWVMSATDWPGLDVSKAKADEIRATRPDLSALSNAALIDRARSMIPLERQFFDDHVVSSSNTAVGPTIVGMVTAAIDPGLMIRLISSSGDVDSAAPSFALWDLSRQVRASDELTAAFDAGVETLMAKLRRATGGDLAAFNLGLEKFLFDFGARGPLEWDVHADVWETKPELALALVDRMRHVDDAQSPTIGHAAVLADREAATAQALAALAGNEEATGMLLAGQASAHRFLNWRERTKTNCVKAINEQRVAMVELGRRLAADGVLSHPKQIFIAVDSELDVLAAGDRSLRSTLDEREANWLKLWELEPPYFVESDKGIPPLESLAPRDTGTADLAGPGTVLQGGPGCAGIVEGIARIILDPADAADLEPGEILVAPQTDPSWTPLFVGAAAVVVDVGAMNSHAVIVSRELGIPCAAGVVDATKRIADGARIRVDGSTGTVTIL